MSNENNSLVSIKILIDGKVISDSYDVVACKVSKQINRIASAKIKLLDGSVAGGNFKLSSSDEFLPGKEIEIQAGWGTQTKCIYKGIIISQNIQFKNHGESLLILDCLDKAIKMKGTLNNNVFTKSTDSDVFKKLAADHELSAEINSTSNIFPQIVQYNTTDWDFLMSRAEVNGMMVVTADNQLKITKPDVKGASLETITFGDNVIEFNVKMDARTQLSNVEATAWDYKNQALIAATASDPSVPDQGNITGKKLSAIVNSKTYPLLTTANLEEPMLQSWADSHLLKSRLAKIRGEIKIFGNASLEPNGIVELEGFGSRFDGDAFVSGITHELIDGDWWSYVNIGLDPACFSKTVEITARPASGLLPGISGLQNGTVKQIHEDPNGEMRIEVVVPIFKNSANSSVWARWAQPYATAGAGQFFMPEIGDEVVLGFLNEDPRFPVVLGSLYSSQKAPPYTPEEGNPKKAIISKNQLKVEFDDEKSVLTITTPKANKMIFSDEGESILIQDQNENKITMDSGGISLESPADIKLSAEGQVTISGTGGVTIASEGEVSVSADANLSMSGLEVSISGETAFSASGGAEASVTAEGELRLTGAMVMIN